MTEAAIFCSDCPWARDAGDGLLCQRDGRVVAYDDHDCDCACGACRSMADADADEDEEG